MKKITASLMLGAAVVILSAATPFYEDSFVVKDEIIRALWSPQQERILVVTVAGFLVVDAAARKTLWDIPLSKPIIDAAYGSKNIFIGCADEILIYPADNPAKKPAIIPVSEKDGALRRLALYDSAYNSTLVAGFESGVIRGYDTGGKERFVLAGHPQAITALVMTGGSTVISAGAEGGSARIWDINTRQVVGLLALGNGDEITRLLYDGKLCYASTRGGYIYVFRVYSGRVEAHNMITTETQADTMAVDFSGNFLISQTGVGLGLWDLSSARSKAQPLEGPPLGRYSDIACHPAENRFITTAQNQFRFWAFESSVITIRNNTAHATTVYIGVTSRYVNPQSETEIRVSPGNHELSVDSSSPLRVVNGSVELAANQRAIVDLDVKPETGVVAARMDAAITPKLIAGDPEDRYAALLYPGVIRIWDIQERQLLPRRIAVEASALQGMALFRKKEALFLLTYDKNGVITVRDALSGKETASRRFPAAVNTVSLNGQGQAAAAWGSTLSVLALPECAVLDEMPFEAAISALAFSRDGIVVCCENGSGSVLTWDAEAGKAALYQLLPFAENPALEVVYSPDDGERFIVSDGETARVYDETGAYLYSLTGSGTSLQFNSAGDTVAGISAGELRFWDFRTGASQRGLPGYNRFYLRPDDSIVAIKDKKFEIIRYGTPVFFHIYYGDDWLVLDKRNNKAIVSENAERHLVVQTTQGDRAFGLSETDETLVERKTKL